MNRHHRVFAGRAEEVPRARRLVAAALDGNPAAEDAALLTSELVTNAVLHSRSGQPGGSFTVSVETTDTAVRVEVRDQGPPIPDPSRLPPCPPAALSADNGLPRRRPAALRADSGRGLFIVEHLAHRWGTSTEAGHRLVWFELDFKPPEPGPGNLDTTSSD